MRNRYKSKDVAWRTVATHDVCMYYHISEDGQVWNGCGGYLVTPHLANGFLRVNLDTVDGEKRKFLVSHLVAEAYLPRFERAGRRYLVCYHDENRQNLHWSNLYCTDDTHPVELRRLQGRILPGTRGGLSRLTVDDVRTIRQIGGTNASVAERFGVSDATISHIRTRQTWRTVV